VRLLAILALLAIVYALSAWVLMIAGGFIHSEVLPTMVPFGFSTALKIAIVGPLIVPAEVHDAGASVREGGEMTVIWSVITQTESNGKEERLDFVKQADAERWYGSCARRSSRYDTVDLVRWNTNTSDPERRVKGWLRRPTRREAKTP
jgi:hypothetical protein